jgi:flavodoxin
MAGNWVHCHLPGFSRHPPRKKQNDDDMKQSLIVVLLFVSVCSSCQTKGSVSEMKSTVDAEKTLIVYLTRTNNTKAIAEIIQKNVGGTLVALKLKTPYPEDYKAIVAQVVKENETGYLPPLKTQIEDIGKYDFIFVGFPTWDMKIPPPIKSFLKQYDLSGKTVIPFNTNAGYGVGSSFETIKELCPKSKVPEGFSIKGGIERDGILFVMEGEKENQAQAEVRNWLRKIKLMKR